METEEPDITFCCNCGAEIEPTQEQWVQGGAKYHEWCLPDAHCASGQSTQGSKE